jgi:hypothetical protein
MWVALSGLHISWPIWPFYSARTSINLYQTDQVKRQEMYFGICFSDHTLVHGCFTSVNMTFCIRSVHRFHLLHRINTKYFASKKLTNVQHVLQNIIQYEDWKICNNYFLVLLIIAGVATYSLTHKYNSVHATVHIIFFTHTTKEESIITRKAHIHMSM